MRAVMMTIKDFLAKLHTFRNANILRDWTVDKLYSGDENRILHKVAITMFPTLEVMHKAVQWGAELLVGHEAALGNDQEKPTHTVYLAKKQFLEDSGLAYFRYHDHPHFMPLDLIGEGTIRFLGLKGKIIGKPYWGITSFQLHAAMTVRDIASIIKMSLPAPHIRIAGAIDAAVQNLAFACGTPGHIYDILNQDDTDVVITGEICEYGEAELVREMAYQGSKKAILVLGHCASERSGMRLLAELLPEDFPELSFRYIECDDVYHSLMTR